MASRPLQAPSDTTKPPKGSFQTPTGPLRHHLASIQIGSYNTNLLTFTLKTGQDCGGGYIKLLSHKADMDLAHFHDKTPYTIMFGPDKCGSDAKLHFIFRHVNPKTQAIEEKHCKRLEVKERGILEESIKDQRTHLYRFRCLTTSLD